MNEDDIQIQPSGAPLLVPDITTDSTDSAPTEDNIDKVVEITDDLNITPIKEDGAIPVKPQTIQEIPPKKTSAFISNLKRLRTYEGDVAEVLARKNISTTSIALAENRRSTGEDRIGSIAGEYESEGSAHTGKKILIALASLVLVGIGIVGAYYLYSISPLAPIQRTATIETAPSLIPSDTQVAIPIDGMVPVNIIRAVRAEIAKQQAPNTVKEIVLAQTRNGQHFRVAGTDMAKIMDIGAPDILLRALASDWGLGVYADASGVKTVFVIATVDYFQNAFAGMLQWESVMADDLKQYLYQTSPTDISTAVQDIPTAVNNALSNPLANIESILPTAATSSKTASSTLPQQGAGRRGTVSEGTTGGNAGQAPIASPQTPTNAITTQMPASTTSAEAPLSAETNPSYIILRGSFIDRIIKNKDVREFTAGNGDVIFLYSFIDSTKLVVTGSESALSEILNRLEQQAFVR